MNKEDSFENPKVIKEYLLKLMIKKINNNINLEESVNYARTKNLTKSYHVF